MLLKDKSANTESKMTSFGLKSGARIYIKSFPKEWKRCLFYIRILSNACKMSMNARNGGRDLRKNKLTLCPLRPLPSPSQAHKHTAENANDRRKGAHNHEWNIYNICYWHHAIWSFAETFSLIIWNCFLYFVKTHITFLYSHFYTVQKHTLAAPRTNNV